jgi:hypothetical protein
MAVGGPTGHPPTRAVTVPLWTQPYDRPRARRAPRLRRRPSCASARSPLISEPYRTSCDTWPHRCNGAVAARSKRGDRWRSCSPRLAAWKCCNLYLLRSVSITREASRALGPELRSGKRKPAAARGRRPEACGSPQTSSKWRATTAPPALRPLPQLSAFGPSQPIGLHELDTDHDRGVRRYLPAVLADPQRFNHP